jgi:rubrerythrin
VKEITKQNLQAAFAGESQAHLKYLIFAERARAQGKSNVARLFEAISFAEQVHAVSHMKALGEMGSTADNLTEARNGEIYEVEEMYPTLLAETDLDKEGVAARSMTWALEAERVHAGLYEDARMAVLAGKDAEESGIYVCPSCGWTAVGEAPDRCPLCNVSGNRFKQF